MALTSISLRDFIRRGLRINPILADEFIARLEQLCENDTMILSPSLRAWIRSNLGNDVERVIHNFAATEKPRLTQDALKKISRVFPTNWSGVNVQLDFIRLFDRDCAAPILDTFILQFTAPPVADPNNVADWNTYLSFVDHNNNPGTFGSVSWDGVANLATLYNWSSTDHIVIKNTSGLTGESLLIQIDDTVSGILHTILPGALVNTTSLLIVGSNHLVSILNGAFQGSSIAQLYAPACTELGATSGDNGVFLGINPPFLTIDLTVSSVLATIDSGNPDGDLRYLTTNYNAIITYV